MDRRAGLWWILVAGVVVGILLGSLVAWVPGEAQAPEMPPVATTVWLQPVRGCPVQHCVFFPMVRVGPIGGAQMQGME